MSKVQSIVEHWLRHRAVTLALLDPLTDDQLSFQPWADAMPLRQLASHIVGSSKWFATGVQNGSLERPSQAAQMPDTAEELRDFAHAVTAETQTILTSLQDDALPALVKASQVIGVDLPGHALLHTMVDHEIHHKGQLFVYARMVGLQPIPFFVKRD